jgi:hypothetical protein
MPIHPPTLRKQRRAGLGQRQPPRVAATAPRRQVADSPDRETAGPLTTLGGVEPVNVTCWHQTAGVSLNGNLTASLTDVLSQLLWSAGLLERLARSGDMIIRATGRSGSSACRQVLPGA